jgi:hypothetical protein
MRPLWPRTTAAVVQRPCRCTRRQTRTLDGSSLRTDGLMMPSGLDALLGMNFAVRPATAVGSVVRHVVVHEGV